MSDICKKCGQSRSYSEGFGKLECSDGGDHDYSQREPGDLPAKVTQSTRKESAISDEQQAEVANLIGKVNAMLLKINQQSLGGGHTSENERLWYKIKYIGEDLKAIGGTALLKSAINEIRREQTQMAEALELTWLGKRVNRLP